MIANLSKTNRLPLALGLLVGILFFAGSGIIAFRNISFVAEDAEQVAHTHEVIKSLDETMLLVQSAEASERGYLITGQSSFLEPYYQAVRAMDDRLATLQALIEGNGEQERMLEMAKRHIDARFAAMKQAVGLYQTEGLDSVRRAILTAQGQKEMEALRRQIEGMENVETRLRDERIGDMNGAYRTAVVSSIVTAIIGIALSCVFTYLIRRTLMARRLQSWLQSGKVGLGTAMFGELGTVQLGEKVLAFLAKYLNAQAGAFFVRERSGLKRIATYGVPAESRVPLRIAMGDGLVGQAAAEHSTLRVDDVPEGYLTVGSSLGQGDPRHLIISAANSDDTVQAVVELGFMQSPDDLYVQLLRETSEAIGVSVRSALYRAHLQELLEETQRQAEELEAQSEELRVNNEELEEQSRALKESQARLEQQQVELEQTNSQLEEQTQLLEAQRDDLARTQEDVQAKAADLERASRYKSDFLANMSHELRTPLNSSLILSKLLADNVAGNLTPEQVDHAKTIHAAGNDLLTLINDILDLSKIEAGHMEIQPETVSLSRLIADMNRTFEPMAAQKGLTLSATVAEGCPGYLETDRKRLEQVLRNLLSNALKFTERGRVDFTIEPRFGDRLAFAVKDTGIGIAPEHHKDIFEAFQQADGTISRKFGGTGLGLSICRQLTRLLGGDIQLESALGKGSTFTVILPRTYSGERTDAASNLLAVPAPAPVPAPEPKEEHSPARQPFLRDDRETLAAGERVLLVVEDDHRFAQILYDLAHDLNFKCLLTNTAEDALALARQYLPSAVLLDVGLPDNSGLSVLDRLKHDRHTRHIPVHVISVSDYSQTALSLGAIGYMLKPVKREDLVEALRRIEGRMSGERRRVLIVEDDDVQRDSVRKLLSTADVETAAVGTAAECLDELRTATYDCMVLDLSLPDSSGYALLETLSKEDTYSFPPVIVYTGRDLSSREEQQLRRYSKSIIIKGAKSPERLLDEVTLFLHQVVSELPHEQQKMIERARNRDAVLEGRRILVVEDDVRNVYALTNILEPGGAEVLIARNGREALSVLERSKAGEGPAVDLILMDVMMPEMDGLTATREIRGRREWRDLPIIMLTAKAMKSDQQRCIEAGANDYMAKPLDVEKLLSLVRVWMPR